MGTGNKMLGGRGGNLRWASIPSKGCSNTPSRPHAMETGVSSGSVGQFGPSGFTFFSYVFCVHTANANVLFVCVLGTLYSWSLILYGTTSDPLNYNGHVPIKATAVTQKPSLTHPTSTRKVSTTKKPTRRTEGTQISFLFYSKLCQMHSNIFWFPHSQTPQARIRYEKKRARGDSLMKGTGMLVMGMGMGSKRVWWPNERREE